MTTLITAYTMGGLITFGAEILCKISNDAEAGLPVNIELCKCIKTGNCLACCCCVVRNQLDFQLKYFFRKFSTYLSLIRSELNLSKAFSLIK